MHRKPFDAPPPISGIERAVEIATSQRQLAKMISDALPGSRTITQQAVNKWANEGLVPWRWCRVVEKLTGVPRAELNPVVYK